MDQDILKNARDRVSSLFGEKLASKASEAFCLAFGHPAAPMIGLEAVGEAIKPMPLVLEFAQMQEVSAEVNRAVEQLRNSAAWKNVRRALGKITLASVTKGVTTEVTEAGRSEPEILPVYAARLLRHVKVLSLRDNFFKIT